MTVSEACEEIRLKLNDTLLKGLGDTKDYGIFHINKFHKNDRTKGIWFDPEKKLSYYDLERKVCVVPELKLELTQRIIRCLSARVIYTKILFT